MAEEMVAKVGEHALARPAGEVRLAVRECDREPAGNDEARPGRPGRPLLPCLTWSTVRPTRYGGASATTVAPRSDTIASSVCGPVRSGEAIQRREPALRLAHDQSSTCGRPPRMRCDTGLVDSHYATSSTKIRSSIPCSSISR